jgi:hypothetical protein
VFILLMLNLIWFKNNTVVCKNIFIFDRGGLKALRPLFLIGLLYHQL